MNYHVGQSIQILRMMWIEKTISRLTYVQPWRLKQNDWWTHFTNGLKMKKLHIFTRIQLHMNQLDLKWLSEVNINHGLSITQCDNVNCSLLLIIPFYSFCTDYNQLPQSCCFVILMEILSTSVPKYPVGVGTTWKIII